MAGPVMDTLFQDIRVALRGLRRSPAFVLTVVATIALGLGLNTSVFTVFDAYVLRSLAVRDPASLYEVSFQDRRGFGQKLSWRRYEEMRTQAVGAEGFARAFVSPRFEGRPLFGQVVTGEAFRVLGIEPMLGRPLVPEDAAPRDGESVVVLSYRTWQATFGGDSSVVGRTIVLHGVSVTVAGVMGPQFTGFGPVPPDFWAPVTLFSRLEGTADLFGATQPQVLAVVLRLRPGVDARDVRAALTAWAARTTADLPDSLRWTSAALVPAGSAIPLTAETIAMFTPAAVAFVLVLFIACANIANLMLARGLARQREVGIRLALGATRRQLVRQLLTESVLLAMPAAALGFLLSQWILDAAVRILYASVPGEYIPYLRVIPLSPDLRVFGFVLVAGLVSAIAFGLLPALQTTRTNVVQAARGEFGMSVRPGRLRAGLVIVQIGVCSLLLIVTGVLLGGARLAGRLPTGMRTHDVVQIDLDDRVRGPALERLRSEPVVSSLGASSQSPLDGVYPSLGLRVAGESSIAVGSVDFVDAGFFQVLDIPIVRGRAFTAAEERRGAPVAVINEAAAHRLWPRGDPIGQVVELAVEPPHGSPLAGVRSAQVIGVARNAVSGWIGTGLERPVLFYPTTPQAAGARIVARIGGDLGQGRLRIDRDLEAVDPGAVVEMHTLDDYLAVQRWPFRIFSLISSAIGVIALVLTLIGIYGLLSYVVAQRTREIGIRMALGASVSVVVRQVLRQSLRYAVVGIVGGAVLALGVSKLFASVLVIVNTFDPAGYVFGAATVLVVCVVAAWAPSRRAARVSPLEALRQE
jgi:predicted permease